MSVIEGVSLHLQLLHQALQITVSNGLFAFTGLSNHHHSQKGTCFFLFTNSSPNINEKRNYLSGSWSHILYYNANYKTPVDQSPWEASSLSASSETPLFLYNSKIHYLFWRHLQCLLSWASRIQSTTSHILSTPGCPKWGFFHRVLWLQ